MKILPNGVAVIDGDSHHAVWCASEGLVHDKFMAGFIRNLMQASAEQGNKIKVVVDGGANIGTLTQVFIEEGAKVHAFEPNPEAVDCLRHNCPTAKVYQCALSDSGGPIQFTPCENAGASFVSNVITGGIQVEARRLDSLAIQPGIIKLDVEGFEVAALRGASGIISRYRPTIIAEVNHGALERAGESLADLLGLLEGLGYAAHIIQPDCRWPDPQFDIVAMPVKPIPS